MVESGGGTGVSDSLEVNLGSMGETQIIAPLSHFSSRGMLSTHTYTSIFG